MMLDNKTLISWVKTRLEKMETLTHEQEIALMLFLDHTVTRQAEYEDGTRFAERLDSRFLTELQVHPVAPSCCPKIGQKVVYTGFNGYDYQHENIGLLVGKEYTVSAVEVDSSTTRVWLEESSQKYSNYFNSVLFCTPEDYQEFLKETFGY